MSESPPDERIATDSQALIERAKTAVKMNQDVLNRLQADCNERREPMQTLERVVSSQPTSEEKPE